jgi:hypothetical protein
MADQALKMRFGFDASDAKAGMASLSGDAAKRFAEVGALALTASGRFKTFANETPMAASAFKALSGAIGETEKNLAKLLATGLKDTNKLALIGAAAKGALTGTNPLVAAGAHLALGNAGSGVLTAASNPLFAAGALASGVSLDKLSGAFFTFKLALAAAAIGATAFAGVIDIVHHQLEELNRIVEGARQADVGTTFFQVWIKQAELAKISTEQAAAALVKASAAVRPKSDAQGNLAVNPISDAMGEQAYGPRKIGGKGNSDFNNAKTTEDALKAVIEYVREMHQAAEEFKDARLDLQAEFVAGLANIPLDLVKQFREAKTNVDAFAAAGLAAGTIMDESLTSRAKELNDRLIEAHRHLSDDMAPAMRALADIGLDFKNAWVKIVEWMAKALDLAKAFNLEGAKSAAEDHAERMINRRMRGGLDADWSNATDPTLRPMTPEMLARSRALNPLGIAWPAPGGKPADVPLPPSRPPRSVLDTHPTEHTPKTKTAAADDKTALDSYLETMKRSNEVLKAEVDTYGKSNKVKEEATSLAYAESAARKDLEAGKRTSAQLTDEERQKVLALADANAKLKDAQAAQERAAQQAKEQSSYFGNMLVDSLDQALQKGADFQKIMQGVVQSLEKAALQALILGQGPLAGLFGMGGGGAGGASSGGGLFGMLGGLFGIGGRAAGAPMELHPTFAAGGWASRPNQWAHAPSFATGGGIPAFIHAGEIILNQAQQGRVASGLSSGNKVTVHNYGGARVESRRMSDGELQLYVDRRVADQSQSIRQGMIGTLADRQARRPVT